MIRTYLTASLISIAIWAFVIFFGWRVWGVPG